MQRAVAVESFMKIRQGMEKLYGHLAHAVQERFVFIFMYIFMCFEGSCAAVGFRWSGESGSWEMCGEVESNGVFGVGFAAMGEVWREERLVRVEPAEVGEPFEELCAGFSRALVHDDYM